MPYPVQISGYRHKGQMELSSARLATWSDWQKDKLKKIPEAVGTAYSALAHGQAGDYRLGRLDDVTRTATVAGIAALGSMNLTQPGASLPLWLGGAGWIGAMALTPQIIYSAVYFKSGLNQNTRYVSSNGDIRLLFQEDPNYMPLQVLPEQTQIKLMNNFNIPLDDPDRIMLLQSRIKQVAVQAHTWWMLMAGMATPVLASFICDRVEDPVKKIVSRLKYEYLMRYKLIPALNSKNSAQFTKALEETMRTSIGTGSSLTLRAQWWKELSGDILKALNLNSSTIPKANLLPHSKEACFDEVVEYLATRLSQSNFRDSLKVCINEKQTKLDRIIKPLYKIFESNIDKIKDSVPESVYLNWRKELDLARDTAEATLQHLRQLGDIAGKPMSHSSRVAKIREKAERSVASFIEQLVNREKDIARARWIAGGRKYFDRFMSSFGKDDFISSLVQTGDSPKNFLLKALESSASRRRWLRRFPGVIGIGMLVATAIYVIFFMGKVSTRSLDKGRVS